MLIAPALCAQGLWEVRSPMPVAATEVASAYLNGTIYTVCGLTETGWATEMSIYDVRRDEWRRGPALPIAGGADHCNFAAAGGKLYLVGAIRIGSAFVDGNTYEFDPQTNSWQTVARMNVPRGASGVAVINNKIYVAGGLAPDRSVNTFEVFDPGTRAWTMLPNMPTARDHLTAQAVNGRFYALAGRAAADLRANEEFDAATNAWRTRAQAPTARGGVASGVINGRIVVFGGEGNSGRPQNTFVQTEEYDPASDSWRSLAPMITARHGMYGVSADGRIFVPGGGPIAGATYSSTNEVFYPAVSTPPAITAGGIVNAGSFRSEPLAPRSIASLFGSNLSNGEQAARALPLPSRMNAVEVRVGGTPAQLIYVSPGQINFIVPDVNPAMPSIPVAVSNAGTEGAPQSLATGRGIPGIFGIVRRATALEIYATGAGLLSAGEVNIIVAGMRAEVLYFGPSGFTGVDQINALIPPGIRGPAVPVAIRTATGESNTALVSIQ
jgi:uncharacterized protein (TIGR03437 family)